MKYDTIKEELNISSDIEIINKYFREYIEQVFNSVFLIIEIL